MSPPSQAADLMAPFATWLGRWEGEGRGLWEAEPPFRYRETLAIEAVPNRALLRLTQRATVLASGDVSHSEVGFLRLLPDQLVELMVVVPAGYVEIHTGRLQDGALVLTPQTISWVTDGPSAAPSAADAGAQSRPPSERGRHCCGQRRGVQARGVVASESSADELTRVRRPESSPLLKSW